MVCAGITAVVAQSAIAQLAPRGPRKSIEIASTPSAPTIDGQLEDHIWSRAAVITDLHQILPVEGEAPTEITEILLLHDENALYIAARMPHRAPGTRTVNILRQGEPFWGDDLFAVILDPFNDQRSGYRFQVNANGVRMEALYQDTTRELWDWTGIWYAGTQSNDEGWTAEMAIPFQSLSFDPNNDTWGINFRRDVAVRDERLGWVSFNRTQDPSNSGIVEGLTGLDQGLGLDVAPSVTLRQVREYGPADDLETEFEPSLDLFYKISPSLNGSLTFNTDFSATEVDDRQVNLTRFGLFFPERRAFFLRDSDIFSFGRLGQATGAAASAAPTFSRATLENGRPFFSRSIGLSATGMPVDLNFGGKISGRAGRWDIGALAIQQDEFGTLAASDLFVGRVAANVLGESSVGIIVTDGNPREDIDNSLIGADFRYFNTRLPGGRTLEGEAWLQQSTTEGIEDNDGAWGLRLRSPNTLGFRWGLGAKELEQNFNPAMGFVNRKGVRDATGELGYTWRMRLPYLRAVFTGLDAQKFDLPDGTMQSEILTWRLVEIDTSRRDRFRLRYYQSNELLLTDFEISEGIFIPPGRYEFDESEVEMQGGQLRPFSGTLTLRTGDFYDGVRDGVSGSLLWRLSEHFRTLVEFEVNDVSLPGGDFTTRLSRLRTDVIFSNTLSWVTLFQYDNISDTVGINSRLHWIPEAGRESYIVLNHNLVDLDGAFHSQSADLSLKYNFTLRF
jgi:hypothetical protein